MILQIDKRLNIVLPNMEPYGCAALLPFWSANKYNGLAIDRALINEKLHGWIEKGWIGKTLYINHWRLIHEDLGLHVQYLGHVNPFIPIEDGQFAYGYWELGGLHHCTALTPERTVSYDPLGDSNFPFSGTLETMRVFNLL